MKILQDLKLICPKVYCDNRGFFREIYREESYGKFVQDNHSFSEKGVLRGMHFQRHPGQAKLITVIHGEIFDVAVDMRPHSSTFGKWEGVNLSAENQYQLFIPIGFAHGFCVLSEGAHVIYKVSHPYVAEEEMTFRYDDPQINICWPIGKPRLSERDANTASFHEVVNEIMDCGKKRASWAHAP